jgi:hypothetical protein
LRTEQLIRQSPDLSNTAADAPEVPQLHCLMAAMQGRRRSAPNLFRRAPAPLSEQEGR